MADRKKGFSEKDLFSPNVKSDLVKEMIQASGISQIDLAEYLNCTINSLRNKLSRDVFSLYDLIVISYACNKTLTITNTDTLENDIEAMTMNIQHLTECIKTKDYSSLKEITSNLIDLITELSLSATEYKLSPDYYLSSEEYQRISNLKKNISEKKYDDFISSLSSSDRNALMARLEKYAEVEKLRSRKQ